MSDWYETADGAQVGFQARSVVGGYFMKVLESKLIKKHMDTSSMGMVDGKSVTLYTIRNQNGNAVSISNYGGTIMDWVYPDKNGNTDYATKKFQKIGEAYSYLLIFVRKDDKNEDINEDINNTTNDIINKQKDDKMINV